MIASTWRFRPSGRRPRRKMWESDPSDKIFSFPAGWLVEVLIHCTTRSGVVIHCCHRRKRASCAQIIVLLCCGTWWPRSEQPIEAFLKLPASRLKEVFVQRSSCSGVVVDSVRRGERAGGCRTVCGVSLTFREVRVYWILRLKYCRAIVSCIEG